MLFIDLGSGASKRPRKMLKATEIWRYCVNAGGSVTNPTAQFLVGRARKRPVLALVALFAAMISISEVCRGHERTVRDLKRIVGRLQDFFTISPTVQHSLERIEQGRQGYWNPTIRYPDKLIELIIKGRREARDVLADFETLERAWREVCPDQPLTIRFVGPSAFEPTTGGRVAPWIHPPEPIDKVNFHEQLPLLRDIRGLILESEDGGDGFGILPISGYQAEPTETGSKTIGASSALICPVQDRPDARPLAIRQPGR